MQLLTMQLDSGQQLKYLIEKNYIPLSKVTSTEVYLAYCLVLELELTIYQADTQYLHNNKFPGNTPMLLIFGFPQFRWINGTEQDHYIVYLPVYHKTLCQECMELKIISVEVVNIKLPTKQMPLLINFIFYILKCNNNATGIYSWTFT